MPLGGSADKTLKEGQRTLAEFFYSFHDPALRRELEQFRVAFERECGETDITRRWTSMLSRDDRQWLLRNHPRRFWNGLPPFVQAFVRTKMQSVGRQGNLDDVPDSVLQLYLSGAMDQSRRDNSR